MDTSKITVLLIEDNPGDARLIREALAEVRHTSFALECATRLADGLARLARGGIDVILLDLSLPDGQGLETVNRVQERNAHVPIVVLTGLDDEITALKTVQQGAQDYLVKGQVDSNVLARAIRYAIERHRMQAELRALLLVDELTGLYNRRGFLTLAGHQLKLAKRMNQHVFLISADVDGLKQINDTWGHKQGDRALMEVAEVLREDCRESDLLARLGGDEFAVLQLVSPEASAEQIEARLREKLKTKGTREGLRCYDLVLSLGIIHCDPNDSRSIDELMMQADALMYEHKRLQRKR